MAQQTFGVLSSQDPASVWDTLPTKVREALLLSGTGNIYLQERVNDLAQDLASMSPEQALAIHPLLADIALHVWELSPLSGAAASIVLTLHKQAPFLANSVLPLCKLCASLKPGESTLAKAVQSDMSNGDIPAAKRHLNQAAKKEPDNFFWLNFASFLGLRFGELDWYEPWLERLTFPGALGMAFKADYLFARTDLAGAEDLYRQAFATSGMPEWQVRQAECLYRLGRRDESLPLREQAFKSRPWQVNLLFALSDLLAGRDLPGELPQGKGAILLYSWNHGQDLDMTLAALAESDLGSAPLLMLDNGSKDSTPEIVAAWKERLGDAMRVITLPTNVGAPAARNWLLSTEEAKQADWVVFLDDDAIVPKDWLRYFGATLRRTPDAAILGCRIVDQVAPLTLQSVDLHLEAALSDPQSDAPFNLVDSHTYNLDFGQFTYERPATSVTGCCHMLTRKGIDQGGLFDLRFSPSQFDDLERDMRSELKGLHCLYQGHLRVRHLKRTGSRAILSAWHVANVEGNIRTFMLSYPSDSQARIARMNLDRQEAFVRQRLSEVTAKME